VGDQSIFERGAEVIGSNDDFDMFAGVCHEWWKRYKFGCYSENEEGGIMPIYREKESPEEKSVVKKINVTV